MAFGNHLCQNDAKTSSNNYCGGFALSAILIDACENGPMAVYEKVQKLQEDVKSGPLYGIIEQMKKLGKGTNICLPSSMVKMAQEAGFKAHLIYSSDLRFPIIPIRTMNEIIKAEENRCGIDNVTKKEQAQEVFDCFSDRSVSHFLVLVNKNTHWVAVKRRPDEKGFSVYDPGTGVSTHSEKEEKVISLIKGLQQSDDLGTLIITLKPLAQ